MKEALVAWKRNEKKELDTVKTELVRDKYKPKVFNRVISKHYGVVYDKRKFYLTSPASLLVSDISVNKILGYKVSCH